MAEERRYRSKKKKKKRTGLKIVLFLLLVALIAVGGFAFRAGERSGSLEIAGRHLARLAVALQVVADLLTLGDFAHARPLDGRDMDEGVGAAVIGLNKAEALGGIEPFYCAGGHDEPFQKHVG